MAADKKPAQKKAAAKKAPAKKKTAPSKAPNKFDKNSKTQKRTKDSASTSSTTPETVITFVSELITANDVKSASLRKRVLAWFNRP